MIPTKEIDWRHRSAVVLLAGLLLLAGCSRVPDSADNAVSANEPSARSAAVIGRRRTNKDALAAAGQNEATTAAQLAAITNQFASVQQAQAESIQRLQNRIEQLGEKETEHGALSQAVQKAREDERKSHEARAQQLQGRIGELENKVASLQAGRVLPEIALTPEDSPTTRALDQKIRIAERNNELAAEAAEARAKESPKLSVGASGFALSSADTNFVLKLRGLVQLDSRTFFDDNPLLQGNDSFVLRRARPIIEGTVFKDFDFQFMPDFGGSSVQIFEAWLNYRYRPELQLRAGKFKGPVGFENLQSDATLPFNERSLVSTLVPVRSVGVQLWGDVADGAVSYAAGVFNGSGDSRNPGTVDFSDDREFAGWLSFQPFKHTGLKGLSGFGFGAGGSYSQVSSNALALPSTTSGTLPGYTSSARQQFFAYNPVVGPVVGDGAHWRLSPYVSFLHGPFGLHGEYAISHQGVYNSPTFRSAELEHTAWQISSQWVLTGEPASFNGIIPNRPFDPRNGGWGAWQLVARYGQLDIDDAAFQGFSNPATSASSATAWAVGINWWLNKNVRVLTSFSHTTFDGGGAFNPIDASTLTPPATVTHQDENALFTRIQLAF